MTTTLTLPAPSLDTIFELLSDRHRRHALYALHRAEDGVMTVDQLTDRVRHAEGDRGSGARHRGEIETALRRQHLPKLVAADVVEYDERSETIRYHGKPCLEEWLEHAEYREGLRPEH